MVDYVYEFISAALVAIATIAGVFFGLIVVALIMGAKALIVSIVLGGAVYILRSMFGDELGNFFVYLRPYFVAIYIIYWVLLAINISYKN